MLPLGPQRLVQLDRGRSGTGEAMKCFALVQAGEGPVLGSLTLDSPVEGCGGFTRLARVDAHGAAVLAFVSHERFDLRIQEGRDALDVLGSSASNNKMASGRCAGSVVSGKKSGSRAATTASTVIQPAWRWSGCRR